MTSIIPRRVVTSSAETYNCFENSVFQRTFFNVLISSSGASGKKLKCSSFFFFDVTLLLTSASRKAVRKEIFETWILQDTVFNLFGLQRVVCLDPCK